MQEVETVLENKLHKCKDNIKTHTTEIRFNAVKFTIRVQEHVNKISRSRKGEEPSN